MTREEAIKELSYIANEMPSMDCADWIEAIGMAIKALEQEPKSEWEYDHEILKAYSDGANDVLDKIRAEIEQAEISDYIRDAKCFRAGLNRALNIIDKYKAESEDKE